MRSRNCWNLSIVSDKKQKFVSVRAKWQQMAECHASCCVKRRKWIYFKSRSVPWQSNVWDTFFFNFCITIVENPYAVESKFVQIQFRRHSGGPLFLWALYHGSSPLLLKLMRAFLVLMQSISSLHRIMPLSNFRLRHQNIWLKDSE